MGTAVSALCSTASSTMPPIAPEPQRMHRDPPKPTCATDEQAEAWAAQWWQAFSKQDWTSGKASEGALYQDPAKLLELMEPPADGGLAPVKLVRGSWLLKRAKALRAARTDEERAKLRVPRRQDLELEEPRALLSPAEVAAMPRGHAGGHNCDYRNACCCCPGDERRPLRLISISHGWLTPDHPDPLGEQLINFADVVARERSCFRNGDEVQTFVVCACCFPCCPVVWQPWHTCFGLPCAGQQCCARAQALPRGEFVVFYDFASLHQKDPESGGRTDGERAAFGSALNTMGTWYAHNLTTTVAVDVLPAGWESTTPYSDRGWTTFESAVSALIKDSQSGTWDRFVQASVGRSSHGPTASRGACRPPPLAPEAFAAKLARKVFTNGKSDLEMVAEIYARTLNGSFGAAERLVFEHAGWGDEEMKAFAKVLPLARSVRFLSLNNNEEVGADGWHALAEAIAAGGATQLEAIYPLTSQSLAGCFSDCSSSDSDDSVSFPTSDGGALKRACEARGIKLYNQQQRQGVFV